MIDALLEQALPRLEATATTAATPFDAIVLAAGAGRRLSPVTDELCKPLVPVLGTPLLWWAVAALRAAGVGRVAMNAHHHGQQVAAAGAVLAGRDGVDVVVVPEDAPTGPAGGARACAAVLPARTSHVVLSGDAWTDVDLGALVDEHVARGSDLTICATPVPDPSRFGVLTLDGDDVVGHREKPQDAAPGALASCGIYVLSDAGLRALAAGGADLADYDFTHVVPVLRGLGLTVRASVTSRAWDDVGTVAALLRANVDALRADRLVRVAVPHPGAPGLWTTGVPDLAADVRCSGTVHVGPGAVVGPGTHLRATTVGARAVVGSGARLDGCVVLPGARVPDGFTATGEVLGATRVASEVLA
ncbi:Nucleotidyl transferase [Cellulomonas flavigena DSM 20109]|uniref:Nucleotidyl transferase n=1 Tax=Cellulomonas flavigena (strain ATCC 482 / DSM 20109 / BCRC 11376 / JCM 18109 / NBRC 3775 / NCIMB 8073 / NRS 134) TaxID=446466 RepID=D5UDL0_CELFN|nr:NDP-sugar synthase [Cellulomonas flavigena]ADG76466.1 Nucleotidyl transferase [Cellulomonas flavigena DSM 20109]